MVYSIDAVARMTGISAFTLRNWEKRYEFLKPKRLENGFRAYDEQHVDLLRKVSALLRLGARIGDLADTIRKGRSLPEVRTPVLAPEVQARAQELLEALLKFDLARAEKTHSALQAEFAAAQMLEMIYAPLLAQMGNSLNSGEASISQHHFVSSFIRLRVAPYLTAPAQGSDDGARKVLCASSSGEHHDGGLMLMTAHLKLRGWSTYYLGSSLPVEEVRAAAHLIRPRIVCLSFTDRNAIASALDQLKRFDCKVCIGGFGALTYDGEDTLPPHLYLYKDSGLGAVEVIETISE